MPVALDATAFNVPSPLRELNFLRPSGPLEHPSPNEIEAIARSLLKQLTEALCRFMLAGRQATQNETVAGNDEADALPKLKIFLSHAKADGVAPARRLRDYIYSQTQLAAFYDENDLAYGSVFARVLQNDLNARETAAMIAVRSARYAGRPWCRRELSLFRRPRRDPLPGLAANRWRLHPTLVVEALEGARQTAGGQEQNQPGGGRKKWEAEVTCFHEVTFIECGGQHALSCQRQQPSSRTDDESEQLASSVASTRNPN